MGYIVGTMGKRKDASPGAAQFGRYRVLSALGQGAMATVYLAEDPLLNRLVAIKVIHSHLASVGNLLDRFTVEAKTAAGLRCPNVVEIFDYGVQDGQQFLVMEYIDGPNLQIVLNLQNGIPLAAEVAAAIIGQAAEGLATAEKNNVVHRDIKPENMMFSSEGILKIADFGIAHINEQNLTQTGSILGSPSFMSPEQIEGGKPTHQTDMFSLGAVFYYCLTGRKPFAGNNIPTIMRSICDLPHPPVVEAHAAADAELTALVGTLLQKAPDARGQGARWLALQLRAYLNQKGVLDLSERVRAHLQQIKIDEGDRTLVESEAPAAAPGGTPPPRRGNTSRLAVPSQPAKAAPSSIALGAKKIPWTLAAGLAVLLLLAIGGAVWLRKKPHPAPPTALPALQSLSLVPSEIEIEAGQSRALQVAAVPPQAAPELGWRSSDTAVAQVAAGLVRALHPGQARIEVFAAADSSLTSACQVTVTDAKPGQNPAAQESTATGTTPAAAASAATGKDTAAEKPAAETASVVIASAPPFAEVFVDHLYLGTTPLHKSDLTPGRHRLLLSHRNFKSLDTSVVIRPGANRMKFHLSAL